MAFSRPWISFREIGEFRRNIDEMLEHLSDKIGYPLGTGSAQKPPLESFVEEGRLIVRAELPGIDPKDISVNVVGDMLTIRAMRQEEHETKRRDFLHREFRYGVLERSMTLPQGVKAEDIKANFSNGLLQLAVPIPEESVPKEVKVHVEQESKTPKTPRGKAS
jgi:HSP20 family protein